MPQIDDKAAEISNQRRESARWMEDSYYGEWEEVIKNYKCIVDVRKDAEGKVDEDKTHIGMPDTYSLVNRRVARITANIPELGFRANQRNEALERSVSLKCMLDWDAGKVQRWQPKHARQAELCGWSVRRWWWERDEFERRRGISIADPARISPTDLEQIAKTYGVDPRYLAHPQNRVRVLAELMAKKGRRGLLDVRYNYKAYEGPRSEVLFVGDVFPKPFFETLQTAGYFIVVRRRNEEWLNKLVKRYPVFAAGVTKLYDDYPHGTQDNQGSDPDSSNFRDNLRAALNMPTSSDIDVDLRSSNKSSRLWSITERWIPGRQSKLAYVGEGTVFLGEIDNPYILDGKIPFTEMILVDDLLGGVGDSVARITRGLQQMHNVATNRRFDLYRMVTHPYVFTNDRTMWDNPEVLNRDLMKLVYTRGGQGSIWMLNESAALAAMASTMGEEASQQRMMQMASGDSNMSMAANVDPAQVRTATGAKLLQANNDVLSKELVTMFTRTSVNEDAEMIYLLNRSEMADAVPIDASKYDRNYDPNLDRKKEEWIQSEPLHFQEDGQLTVKVGSTLADDDEAEVSKATNLYTMLSGNPEVNQRQLTQDLLISHGKGAELNKYMAAPPPPPPPETKGSISISIKGEELSTAQKIAALEFAGITPQKVEEAQQVAEQQAAAQMGGPMLQLPPGAGAETMPTEIDPTNVLGSSGEGVPLQ